MDTWARLQWSLRYSYQRPISTTSTAARCTEPEQWGVPSGTGSKTRRDHSVYSGTMHNKTQRYLHHRLRRWGCCGEVWNPLRWLDSLPIPKRRFNFYISGKSGYGKDVTSRAIARSWYPDLKNDDGIFFLLPSKRMPVSSKYRSQNWAPNQEVSLFSTSFVLVVRFTAMPSVFSAPRCVRNMSIIIRSLIRTAALCAGYTHWSPIWSPSSQELTMAWAISICKTTLTSLVSASTAASGPTSFP